MKRTATFVRALCGLAVVVLLVACGSARSIVPAGADVTPYVVQSGRPPSDWVVFQMAGGVEVGLVAGPDGAMWFTQYNPSAITRIGMDGTTTTYPVTGAGNPLVMTLGPDGNLWFTTEAREIGRITPSGQVSLIPTTITQRGIATGPLQGNVRNLWFTAGQDKIFELTTKGRTKAKFTTPTPRSYPTAITTGPDGNLWFTEIAANKIGRMSPEGVFAEFPLPQKLHFSGFGLGSIAVGKDGNIYTLEEEMNRPYVGELVRITPSGVVTAIDIGDDQPVDVAIGPDGNPWFHGTVHGLGFFSIAKHKVYHLGFPPDELSTTEPSAIAAGPDGNIWLPVVTATGQDIDVFVRRIMTVNPDSVSLSAGQSQPVVISETKYFGLWTAASSNVKIATVAPGGSKDTFVVTAVGQGDCTITISDFDQNSVPVPVAVR